MLIHALNILKIDAESYSDLFRTIFDHTVNNGIDMNLEVYMLKVLIREVFMIMEKEFWQQAEVLIGLLDAVIMFGDEKYWDSI